MERISAVSLILALLGHTLPLGSGEHAHDSRGGCRVAVCLSGHIHSFVHPGVHLSIKRNLIEAIEADGCHLDVFAYATLNYMAGLKEKVGTEFGLFLE